MIWTPWAILAGLVLEAIMAVIERHATHVKLHEVHPEYRFFQYGTRWSCTDFSCEARHVWFFVVRLPIYQWVPLDYGHRLGWGQLHLVWESGEGWSQSGYHK